MLDSFNRRINYLRISVTDKCNLRCRYCMPEEGIPLMSHDEILSFEQIVEIVKKGVELGMNKVRLTGGEPLVRKKIINLVSMIGEINGITDFAMTTNGILLKKYAKDLFLAGLHRVNISLDTLDPKRYSEITRGGNLNDVLDGIKAAGDAGLNPIKLNCVVKESSSESDARLVFEYAKKHKLEVRFIREMNISKGLFWVVEGGNGGNCNECNRLRLTCNGVVRPCLFSDCGFDIKETGIEGALVGAIKNKPEFGILSTNHKFYNIGG